MRDIGTEMSVRFGKSDSLRLGPLDKATATWDALVPDYLVLLTEAEPMRAFDSSF